MKGKTLPCELKKLPQCQHHDNFLQFINSWQNKSTIPCVNIVICTHKVPQLGRLQSYSKLNSPTVHHNQSECSTVSWRPNCYCVYYRRRRARCPRQGWWCLGQARRGGRRSRWPAAAVAPPPWAPSHRRPRPWTPPHSAAAGIWRRFPAARGGPRALEAPAPWCPCPCCRSWASCPSCSPSSRKRRWRGTRAALGGGSRRRRGGARGRGTPWPRRRRAAYPTVWGGDDEVSLWAGPERGMDACFVGHGFLFILISRKSSLTPSSHFARWIPKSEEFFFWHPSTFKNNCFSPIVVLLMWWSISYGLNQTKLKVREDKSDIFF